MRYGRRATTAVACAAVAAMSLAGCGGGGGDKKGDDKPSSATSSSAKASGGEGAQSPSPSATQVLAQIRGEKDIEVTINSAVRDSGGFVTVEGEVTNNGTEQFDANDWVGNETALAASGASVAGAVLVDEAGKKRYYVLRDTEGKCLCTMKLLSIQPKETRPFFAQFPSPPETTTSVEFELPTMPPAKISISEG
ncbi:hypothetical protein SAMN05216223_10264 [Actinacidiphila yanglinensis]|uniref:Secreted protein n=1 Tax=Actinacidiphila yanglinensis TaxID=310779 RepID=A0A1H5UZQ2_9ACTN|nr:hypothetical protein [Actinacidiphila yanglinensis]SEF79931.1 hypothetical protein SAMN05216223_10264 [Actinacidiphila yanglinensis]